MGDVVAFRRRTDGGPAGTRPTLQRPTSTSRTPPPRQARGPAPAREPLWRELVGAALRDARIERGETQRVVADRAGISVQYLSEIERGRKEPSSEMLAAVGGALGLPLVDLTRVVGRRLIAITGRPTGPVALAA